MQQIGKSFTSIKSPEKSMLEGFKYKDEDVVISKLRNFATSGINSLHLVSDFDLTLTAGKQPGQNLGTWDVMDELIPPEGVRRHTEIYQSFRPIELKATHPNVILIGDVPDDTKMVLGDNVIRVRVLDPRKGESHIPEEALATSFDAG